MNNKILAFLCCVASGVAFIEYGANIHSPWYVWIPLGLLGIIFMDLRGWLKYNPKITSLGIELGNHVKYRKILEAKLGLEGTGDRVTDRLAELGETFEARK